MTSRNENQSSTRSTAAGTPRPSPVRPFPRAWMVAVVLAISLGAVYGWALNVPFIYDDKSSIVTNDSIKSLWPLVGTREHPAPLTPPIDTPMSARPLVNLSFALNYYFGGFKTTGYHVVNLMLHFCSSLLLWAITSRSLRPPYFAGRFESSANWLALAVAMLWALHPLQTEAVIYATQRTELMMSVFYLGTLYCSLRYWSANSHTIQHAAWLTLAVFASLAGMASKEVMVSAPFIILLYERTFLTGSFAKALRRSWPLYVGLASTWVLLLALALNSPHGQSAGFGLSVSAADWWLTQAKVLLLYLKLFIWPWPLSIHYHFPYLSTFGESWMYVVPILLLAGVTILLLWRNNPIGFLGAWVFAILSPTCVIPIVTEIAAERRMYLPLAALVVLLVMGGYWLAQSLLDRLALKGDKALGPRLSAAAIAVPVLLLSIAYGSLSAARLTVFADEVNLWRESLRRQPLDPDAHSILGSLLLAEPNRQAEALEELQTAVKLRPRFPDALSNLGVALTHAGRPQEAIDALRTLLSYEPQHPVAYYNLGLAMMQLGRLPEAIESFEHAIQLRPNYASAHNSLGIALYRTGRGSEAIEHLRTAVQINENDVNAQSNLGQLLHAAGNSKEAIPHLEKAMQLQPELIDAHNALADAYAKTSRPDDAIRHFQAILQQQPNYIPAYANLAHTFATVNRSEEAMAAAQKGVEVARAANQQNAAGQLEEWLEHYRGELQRTK